MKTLEQMAKTIETLEAQQIELTKKITDAKDDTVKQIAVAKGCLLRRMAAIVGITTLLGAWGVASEVKDYLASTKIRQIAVEMQEKREEADNIVKKLRALAQGMSTAEVNNLTLGWHNNVGTNDNGQIVAVSAPIVADSRVKGSYAYAWQAVTTLKTDFATKPRLMLSLVELDEKVKGKRYYLSAEPLDEKKYRITLIVWDLPETPIKDLQISVQCLAMGNLVSSTKVVATR
jgi:hypothetical protein